MSGAGQRVLSLLRKMIVDGELAAGDRVTETSLAERLGVSRMPIRMAFRALKQEGLLIAQGARGLAVRKMSAEDLAGAVEVRGVLEGLAARQAAERGLSPQTHTALLACLADGDKLFEKGFVSEDDLVQYHDINKRFHQLVVAASANLAIAEALARHAHLPFASVSSLAVDRNNLAQEYRRFNFAHLQHHAAVDALANGQGARAEAIMREHANATLRYATLFGPIDTIRNGVKIIN
jgi:GntR family transcriptional regulator of vanillate catabolism